MKYIKYFKKENGVAAVFIGLVMVAIVGILAYVIDTGSLYQARRSMQSAADAAALAGVQELPNNPDVARQVAIDYVVMQGTGIPSSDVSVSIGNTLVANDTITVTVSDPDIKTIFAGIFGVNSASVGANATAMIGSPTEIKGVLPWAVLEGTYTPGTEYTLKYGDPALGPGNFGAVRIGDSSGGDDYRECIMNGSTTPVHIGSILYKEGGAMTGPTYQGAIDRIEEQSNGQFDTFSQLTSKVGSVYKLVKPDSQFIIIPIVDNFPAPGHDTSPMTVVGFFQFIITYAHGSTVKATLVNYAMSEDYSGFGAINSTGFRATRLLE